jgi:hypothetical protein
MNIGRGSPWDLQPESQQPLLYTSVWLKGTLSGMLAKYREDFPSLREGLQRMGTFFLKKIWIRANRQSSNLTLWQRMEIILPSLHLQDFSGGKVFYSL